MTESNIFKLLDFDLYDKEGRQRIDTDAIIKEAQKNPHDINAMYTFSRGITYRARCPPLHQAIALGLGIK
eukprot:2526980-Ditylum_brightwellii.AAC.1